MNQLKAVLILCVVFALSACDNSVDNEQQQATHSSNQVTPALEKAVSVKSKNNLELEQKKDNLKDKTVSLKEVARTKVTKAVKQAEAVTSEYQQGKDYTLLLNPVKTANPNKIEVVEVFWYRCIHCFRLETELATWKNSLADDVDFVLMPGIWAKEMELHAAALYANVALGLIDKLHSELFKVMNVNKNPLSNEDAVLDFVESKGVDREKYRRALNSFGVKSQVLQAKSKMGAYQVRGTPELIVNGKYKITTAKAGSYGRMLKIASALIAKERAAK